MNAGQRRIVEEDCARVVGAHAEGMAALRRAVILITGGTGFMGTWLAEMIAWLNDQHKFGIRLLLLSDKASQFRTRVPHLATRSDIKLIEQNVIDIVELPAEVNWIIHAAADPDSRKHALDALGTLRVIVRGTDAVLQAAAKLGNLQKVLHISSGLIYGALPRGMNEVPESHVGAVNCASPGQAYAEGKRAAETVCAGYRTQYRLPIVTARPFAFLGPYQLLDRPWAANQFIRDSLRGGPLRIQGDGQSVRSYMYPADMAWWALTMLARGTSGAAYNLGSPHGISLLDMAGKIAGAVPRPVNIVQRVLGGAAPQATRIVPDISLARESLGLEIRTDLDSAIRLGLQWYQALADYGA